MKLLTGLAAMLVAAAPSAQEQERRTPAPRLASITVETTSWGKLIARWSIDARGELRYTSPEPDIYNPVRFVTRRYAAGTAGFRRIRVMLGTAEVRAGHNMPCTQRITDATYGEVRWTRPNRRVSKLNFYSECNQFATRRVTGQIAKADALAAQWARSGVIIETRAGDAAP